MALKEFKILKSHGKQFVPDIKAAITKPPFRGRPVIDISITATEAMAVAELCPVNAIQASPFALDLGKCVFCNECKFALPDKINFTNDHKIAVNRRDDLIIKAGEDKAIRLNSDFIRKEVKTMFKQALKLRQISAGGDNSAEIELNAAGNVNFDMGRYGVEFVASPRHADGIVITGPITENMAKATEICYEATPSPKLIILVGTDAISGGIFADSKAIERSFLNKYTVDLFVPGNPPHPLTFINGVLDLIGR